MEIDPSELFLLEFEIEFNSSFLIIDVLLFDSILLVLLLILLPSWKLVFELLLLFIFSNFNLFEIIVFLSTDLVGVFDRFIPEDDDTENESTDTGVPMLFIDIFDCTTGAESLLELLKNSSPNFIGVVDEDSADEEFVADETEADNGVDDV
ncbi:unnamed protein product [[Candida] boidinii]|uniref:Unnamed protein product n=1 Tax=Candida boidinii TaxID=5477 RepID=A0ACB5UAK7_CANBO|nr:unnamed protein product [[Candida] boidinii]